MLCWLLSYRHINQPQVYICPLLCEPTYHQFSFFFLNQRISLRLINCVVKMFVAKISMAKTLPMKTLNIILKMQTLRHKKVK